MNKLGEKILVSVPAYDGRLHCGCAQGLMESAGVADGFAWNMFQSLIPRARNLMAHTFLEGSNCDRVVMVDSDLSFTREHLERLVNHDVGVVAGVYPLKRPDGPWVWTDMEGRRWLQSETEQMTRGLERARWVATGFLSVRREVFERLMEVFPERAYKAGGKRVWDFFPAGVWNGEYLSEDYYFCELCRYAGIEVYADAGVRLGHTGSWTFGVTEVVG